MLTPQQLAVPGIGSSLAPMIVGADPYGSLSKAYQTLVDPALSPDISDELPVLIGNIFEDGACRVLERVAAIRLRTLGPSETFRHATKPHLKAHPDRIVIGEPAVVEAKVRGPQMARYYADNDGEPLLSEYVQTQHQMLVTGAAHAYLIVLFTNRTFRWWKIPANADDMALIERECDAFWNTHVLPRVPPDPQTENDVKLRWPISVMGKTVEGTNEHAEIATTVIELQHRIHELEETVEKHRVSLMRAMGDAESLRYDGRVLCTYKSQKHRTLDVKLLREEEPSTAKAYERESTHRVLRLKQPIPAEHA